MTYGRVDCLSVIIRHAMAKLTFIFRNLDYKKWVPDGNVLQDGIFPRRDDGCSKLLMDHNHLYVDAAMPSKKRGYEFHLQPHPRRGWAVYEGGVPSLQPWWKLVTIIKVGFCILWFKVPTSLKKENRRSIPEEKECFPSLTPSKNCRFNSRRQKLEYEGRSKVSSLSNFGHLLEKLRCFKCGAFWYHHVQIWFAFLTLEKEGIRKLCRRRNFGGYHPFKSYGVLKRVHFHFINKLICKAIIAAMCKGRSLCNSQISLLMIRWYFSGCCNFLSCADHYGL